jgi:Uma2 family endonuclease
MSVTSQPSAPVNRQPPGVPSEPIWRLSVEQYHEMARAGILTRDDRVELLEGWLVAKMTKHPPHVIATGQIHDALRGIIPDGWYVTKEDPVTTLDSEPEPDLAVIRGTRRDYSVCHPGPHDVALVVEVADTSLPRDQTFKKGIYARAQFPLYWLVNLPEARIEVYSDPRAPSPQADYRQRQDYGPPDAVPLVIDGREVGRLAVRELLP